MKKIVTIFENLEQIHLKKDVGMVPYSINIENEYDTELWATSKSFSDETFEKQVCIKFIHPFRNRKINRHLAKLICIPQQNHGQS